MVIVLLFIVMYVYICILFFDIVIVLWNLKGDIDLLCIFNVMLEFELVLFLMIKYVLLFDLSFMDNKGIFSLIM